MQENCELLRHYFILENTDDALSSTFIQDKQQLESGIRLRNVFLPDCKYKECELLKSHYFATKIRQTYLCGNILLFMHVTVQHDLK